MNTNAANTNKTERIPMQFEILRLHLQQALSYAADTEGVISKGATDEWLEAYRWEDLFSMEPKGPCLRPEALKSQALFIGIKNDGEAVGKIAQGEYRLEAGSYVFAQIRPSPSNPSQALLAFCRQAWWEGKLSNSEFNLNSEFRLNSEFCLRHVREDGAWALQILTKEMGISKNFSF
jgi:hypothetical protein